MAETLTASDERQEERPLAEERAPEQSPEALQALLKEREEQLAATQAELAALQQRIAQMTARYREALLRAHPEVPAELLHGETPDEVEAALEAARAMVERVRRWWGERTEAPRVPVGAPPRRAPDLSGLTAREKILLGLAQRSAQGS